MSRQENTSAWEIIRGGLFAPGAASCCNSPMSEASRREIRAGLELCLARLWRYALILSSANDTADDLVQATCLRAIERADQFDPGTRLDRWLFTILRSIWLNEIRARKIREGGGFVDAEDALSIDVARDIETNILAGQVLKEIRQAAMAISSNPLRQTDAVSGSTETLAIPVS